MPDQNDAEYASWLESRRLIIAQLATMDRSIRELGDKVDRYRDQTGERATEMSRDAQAAISDIGLRVSMLELRAKLWGGVIGLVGGGVATVVVQLVTKGMGK